MNALLTLVFEGTVAAEEKIDDQAWNISECKRRRCLGSASRRNIPDDDDVIYTISIYIVICSSLTCEVEMETNRR